VTQPVEEDPTQDPNFIPADSPDFIPPPAQDSGMDGSGPTDRNASEQIEAEWPEWVGDDADEG
jgi:hypothetical protein